jgi:hypothetical protein
MQFLAYIAVLLIATYVAYALAPKPPQPKPASLEDFDIPTAEEGRPLPMIFGTVLVRGPNVIWYGDLGTEPIKSKSGKK